MSSLFEREMLKMHKGLTSLFGDESILLSRGATSHLVTACFNPSFAIATIVDGQEVVSQSMIFEVCVSQLPLGASVPIVGDTFTRNTVIYPVVEVHRMNEDWVRCFVHEVA